MRSIKPIIKFDFLMFSGCKNISWFEGQCSVTRYNHCSAASPKQTKHPPLASESLHTCYKMKGNNKGTSRTGKEQHVVKMLEKNGSRGSKRCCRVLQVFVYSTYKFQFPISATYHQIYVFNTYTRTTVTFWTETLRYISLLTSICLFFIVLKVRSYKF